MKAILYLVASTIFFAGCEQVNGDHDTVKTAEKATVAGIASDYLKDSLFHKVYFSKPDAELILGEPAYLSDSSSSLHTGISEIKLTYTANAKDQSTGKKGAIYFMIEEYDELIAAKNAYRGIKVANENHDGFNLLQDVGDEAYFHSDGENFLFILARKQNRMFRIKVNKITSHTSLEEFNRVSKKIAELL